MTVFAQNFKDFSIKELQTNGDMVREWSKRTDNPLLATLATEVMKAAGAAQ